VPNGDIKLVETKRPPTKEALTYDLNKFKPLATVHHTGSVSSKRGDVSDVCFAPSPLPSLSKSLIDLVERPLRQFSRLWDLGRLSERLAHHGHYQSAPARWGDVAERNAHPE
jgi:hypothetical protein